ncbi:dual specificity protein phosphatase family protein [Flavobacteriaceae bacterium]|nr:dual specificity protein phosphatase family protein [Flavobacteriaceae bacterium]
MKKKIGLLLLSVILIGVSKYVYEVHFNYNFKEISENKVYKSGVIPPEKIADYVEDHQLKSVIDLRFPHTLDKVNNPEIPQELTDEKEAVELLEGVTYFNLGTDQVPTQETVDKFLEIMDDSSNYPVLIHCYHGVGRAQMFSALYRIEYEGWTNQEAREKTRLLLKGSSFDEGAPKGDYLINYKPRSSKE